MNRDFLLDIVELIDKVERHRPEGELVRDEVLLTAVIHWVQTIGEAGEQVGAILEELERSSPQQ